MPRRTFAPIVASLALLLATATADARGLWNDCGHRVIAAIAYNDLSPAERRAVSDLLAAHPAARHPTFWSDHVNNGDDPALNRFMNAAIFPDEARGGLFSDYNIGPAHYVNYRLMVQPDGTTRVLTPIQDLNDDDPHGDVLESLAANLRIARDPAADPADRAVALSWIFHQVGDLHQPLHNVARFCPATPEGDRGGNEIRFGEGRLHGYWDDALCTDSTPANVERLAAELMAEHPRVDFAAPLAEPDIGEWSREGVALALRYVYNNLDPAVASFDEPPVGYAADAHGLSRRQCTLAGYRLADALRSVVAPPPAAPASATAPTDVVP